ncbi:MAG: hypothetical protein U0892_08330 [Pirellulales bacterium]
MTKSVRRRFISEKNAAGRPQPGRLVAPNIEAGVLESGTREGRPGIHPNLWMQ